MEKLDKIGSKLETYQRKSTALISQQTGISKSSTKITTKMLHLYPCKTTVIHEPTQIMGQFMQCIIEKQTPHLICLMVKYVSPQ